MALNVLQESQKQYESLSDRLNKMDQYINQYDPTSPQKFASVFEGRPAGVNPAALVSSATNLSTTFGRTRGDLATQQGSALDRLIKLQPEGEDPLKKLSASDVLNAQEKGYKFIKNEDGTLGLAPISETNKDSDTKVDDEFKAIVSGIKTLNDVPKELRDKVQKKLSDSGFIKDPLASQKKSAQAALDVLEKLYGRGDASKVGGKEDLSLASGGNLFQRAGAVARDWTKAIADPKLKEDANIYKNQLQIALGVFSQAFGSGTPQEGEAKRLIESAPGLKSSNREAQAWFKSVKELLATPEMKILNQNTGSSNIVTAPDGTQIEITD